MTPHIFTHFLPSNAFPDVQDHFRNTARGANEECQAFVYLAGDCTVFEGHLDSHDTMAFQLAEALKPWGVLNAGAPHYTALHAYNRLVYDIMRGYKPSVVVLFSAANDVLSFIHHKSNSIDPAHTHLYRPWLPYGGCRTLIDRMPLSVLKLALGYMCVGKHGESWDHSAESLNEEFFLEENVQTARKLFSTLTYNLCLRFFHTTCKEIGARLVLTTFHYHKLDMSKEPRRTYAWGIDQLNEEARIFAQSQDILIVDLARELDLSPGEDIHNKWVYTRRGNEKRMRVLEKSLVDLCGGISKCQLLWGLICYPLLHDFVLSV